MPSYLLLTAWMVDQDRSSKRTQSRASAGRGRTWTRIISSAAAGGLDGYDPTGVDAGFESVVDRRRSSVGALAFGAGGVEEDAGGGVDALQPRRRDGPGLPDEGEADPLAGRVVGLAALRRRRRHQVHLARPGVEVLHVVEHDEEVAVAVRHRPRRVHHLAPVAHHHRRRACMHARANNFSIRCVDRPGAGSAMAACLRAD